MNLAAEIENERLEKIDCMMAIVHAAQWCGIETVKYWTKEHRAHQQRINIMLRIDHAQSALYERHPEWREA